MKRVRRHWLLLVAGAALLVAAVTAFSGSVASAHTGYWSCDPYFNCRYVMHVACGHYEPYYMSQFCR